MELYIGIMSGTSMDGVDAVLVSFDQIAVRQVGFRSLLFPEDLRDDLHAVVKAGTVTLAALGEIDHRLALVYADCVNHLIAETGVGRHAVKAIGCHGQTIWHAPGAAYPFTMQIGNGNLLAALTGIPVVTDFRRMDMAFGGGGAPLACGFHQYFLNSRQEKRGILNLGGIANITILAGQDDEVVGFDTGPANCLMDSWIKKCRNLDFDRNGDWAGSGKIIEELLDAMLTEPYFHADPPKSTGRELFNLNWLLPYLRPGFAAADVQATLLELTALSVAKAVSVFFAGCHLCLRRRCAERLFIVPFIGAFARNKNWYYG